MTGKLIPKQRPWYNDAKNAGKTVFTEPYVDKNTGKLVVSVVSPFKGTSGFYGTLCTDIALDIVSERAKAAKYRGEAGQGIVIDTAGISAWNTHGAAFIPMRINRQLYISRGHLKYSDIITAVNIHHRHLRIIPTFFCTL